MPPLLTGLTTAAILIVGGQRVIDGSLSIGALVAFQYLIASFIAPVDGLVTLGGELQEVEAGMVRLDDVLATRPIPSLADIRARGRSVTGAGRLSGALELRDVTFGYSPLEPPLIDGFSLTVEPGARVALVGGSGSGKSTIARLVVRSVRAVERGDPLRRPAAHRSYPRDVLVNSLALVDQEIVLFEGTVSENLTLWDATRARAAGRPRGDGTPPSTRTSSARAGGYDSHVDEGGRNWSGGQRQRLEIARALVADPSILVLDEATSALDPTTEQRSTSSLRRRGCTCLIVAHRLSTIRDCDEIIVLERGEVVQRGTHDELDRRPAGSTPI